MLHEIERKFLVKDVEIKDVPMYSMDIVQFYIGKMRFRKQVHGLTTYYWNMKFGKGIKKIELETRIPKFVYEFFWMKHRPGGILTKTRSVYRHGKHKIELDTFTTEMYSGLKVAEIELAHENEEILPLPEWVGDEVTGDKRYNNRRMANKATKKALNSKWVI